MLSTRSAEYECTNWKYDQYEPCELIKSVSDAIRSPYENNVHHLMDIVIIAICCFPKYALSQIPSASIQYIIHTLRHLSSCIEDSSLPRIRESNFYHLFHRHRSSDIGAISARTILEICVVPSECQMNRKYGQRKQNISGRNITLLRSSFGILRDRSLYKEHCCIPRIRATCPGIRKFTTSPS